MWHAEEGKLGDVEEGPVAHAAHRLGIWFAPAISALNGLPPTGLEATGGAGRTGSGEGLGPPTSDGKGGARR